jgi:FtsZ-binding cell division protein ZapB
MAPNEARFKENLPSVVGGDSCYLQQQNYSLEALAKRDAQQDPFTKGQPASQTYNIDLNGASVPGLTLASAGSSGEIAALKHSVGKVESTLKEKLASIEFERNANAKQLKYAIETNESLRKRYNTMQERASNVLGDYSRLSELFDAERRRLKALESEFDDLSARMGGGSK